MGDCPEWDVRPVKESSSLIFGSVPQQAEHLAGRDSKDDFVELSLGGQAIIFLTNLNRL
jgi:hypothetical protein